MSLLQQAFPRALASELAVVLAALPEFETGATLIGPLSVGGEKLSIPARVYLPATEPRKALDEPERLLRACIYSRHHDGRVRQKQVADLMSGQTPWSVPYLIQLVGEYVVEILSEIEQRPELLASPVVCQFIAENEPFWQLTKARVTSYWNEYYRRDYPRFADYPGSRIISAVEQAL